MKRFVLSFLCCALGLAPLARGAVPAHPAPAYVEGRVIVKYRAGLAARSMAREALGLTRLRSHLGGRIETLALPGMTTVAQVLPALRADPSVEYAEPDFIRAPRAVPQPNDPFFSQQWALQALDLPDAWDPSHDGTFPGAGDGSATVAIIDDSLRVTHEDLAANVVAGYDFAGGDADPSPGASDFHGTLVGGCVGAVGNNGKGIAGAAWNVKLMPLRFDFQTDTFLAAMDFARTHGANIVNASFGGPQFSQAEADAIQALAGAGILFVAAAGNDDSDTDVAQLNYPANYAVDSIVAVAASSHSDSIAGFSQYGPVTTDVAAPGVDIITTSNDGYASASGSSFSAPYAAGVAALLKMKFPSATPRELKARLIEGAQASGNSARRTAGGLVDAASSLNLSARPSLVIGATGFDGNGVLDPGESAVVHVTLDNLWSDAANVAATLTADQGITASDGAVDFGAIAADGSATRDFHLTVPSGITTHRYVEFTLSITADGYSAVRRFRSEIGALASGIKVSQGFAGTDTDPYDDFHAWHFDLASLPAGHDQLVIETTAPADIDLLVKRGAPPVYDITVGINPEVDQGFFCTSGMAENCQDPDTQVSGGTCGNERVVIDNPAPGTYHAVVVNFAQHAAALGYTIKAYTRAHKTDGPLCASGGGGGGGLGAALLLPFALAGLARRRRA